jgi:chromosome segregation ATPase
MLKQSQLERLTHVQLIQRVIHLESELSHCRVKIENLEAKHREETGMLLRENERLKAQVNELLDDQETYEQERDELIKEYNELLLKNAAEGNHEIEKENEKLRKDLDKLQKEFSESLASLKACETQLVKIKESKEHMTKRLKNIEKKNRLLQEENKQLIGEKKELQNKIVSLLEENASFHNAITKLKEQRLNEDKGLDKLTMNINEVFMETKELVRMTSSLKHQLETKTNELTQLKKEKQLLIDQIIKLQNHYEQSELRNKELESNFEALKKDFLLTKESIARFDQFEEENRKLRENLKSKIEEFNFLTEKYEEDKAILEKQIEQMRRKMVELESDLKEKENIIRQLIQQTSSLSMLDARSSEENIQQMPPKLDAKPNPKNNQGLKMDQQQITEWFRQLMMLQQKVKQPYGNSKNSAPVATDFFTLRKKSNELSQSSTLNNAWKSVE